LYTSPLFFSLVHILSLFPKVQFLTSVAAPGQFPPDSGWEVAVAGRSNSGKSTAINAVLARKGMARTSRTPGRTRLYNYFELEPGKRLVDLPGYGHAEVNAATRATWGPLGEALLERQSFAALLVVIDSRRGVSELDLGLLEWAGRPEAVTHVLLSKSDKLPSGQARQALTEARAALAGRASCQLFSALKGTGLEDARAVLKRWIAESAQKK
jgi:GTP-binding protein